jgi:hypothetical protein
MLRRLLPLLIAFSLLMSQLATQSHVYSHWTGGQAAAMQSAASAATSDPVLSDVLCQLCLVGGQLASAINGSVHRLHVAATPAFFLSVELYQRLDRITTVVFRSRAPPAR